MAYYLEKVLRFQPTDKQKMAYLLYKVSGKPFPCNGFIFIPTVNLNDPWDEIFTMIYSHNISSTDQNQENYFFTRLVKRTTTTTTTNNNNEGGGNEIWHWQSISPSSRVRDKGGRVLGFVESYIYKLYKNAGNPADRDGKWIMKQYTLADEFKCCVKNEYVDCALCSVKKLNRDGSETTGSLDIESFFDQMLGENTISSSSSSFSSSSSNCPSPPNSAVQEINTDDDQEVVFLSNEFHHGSPSLDLGFCGFKK